MNTRRKPALEQLGAEKNRPFSTLQAGLHLFVLGQLAVAQPLLDLAARNPELFAARRSGPADLLALVLVLGALPPLLLLGLTQLIGGPAAARGRRLHLLWVGSALAAFSLPLAGRLPWGETWWAALPAAACAVAGTWAYARLPAARLLTSAASPILLLTPLLFFLDPDIRKILAEPAETLTLPRVEPGRRPPIVIVVFDELPLGALLDETGGIDPGRFPAFAELASRAHWFRNATTVAAETPFAVPALLTGRFPDPERGRSPRLAEHPQNLFTLLGRSYEIVAAESQTFLCPKALNLYGQAQAEPFPRRLGGLLLDLGVVYAHLLTPRPGRALLPPLDASWKDFWRQGQGRAAREAYRVRRFERFLDEIASPAEGRLFYLHSLLPHMPWEHLPSGKAYNDRLNVPGLAEDRRFWRDDAELTALGYQRFLLQLQAADRLLGLLLERLRDLGIYERALVAVTADHGASFRPGSSRRGQPGEDLRAEIMPVPLWIKTPHQREARRSDENAESVDLLPTVAEVLALELPWAVDGRSLLAAAGPERPRKVIYAGRPPRPFHYPADRPLRDPVVEERLALFGSGGGGSVPSLFAFGPHARWVGRPVEELPAAAPGAGEPPTAVLRSPSSFAGLDPEARFLPAQVIGTIEGEPGPGEAVAVALGGVVRTVVPLYALDGEPPAFSAMLPEEAFAAGELELDLLLVSGSGPATRFLPLPLLGRVERLARELEASDSPLLQLGGRGGFPGLAPGADTRLQAVGSDGESLRISSRTIAPEVELPTFEASGHRRVLLRLRLESHRRSRLLLRYETSSPPSRRRHLERPLAAGSSEIVLALDDPDPAAGIRLRLGRGPGSYLLRSVELRGGGKASYSRGESLSYPE